MDNTNNIEQLNRVNFRSSLEALARPGQLQLIEPLFDSRLQAMASVLLYSEVSYCYEGKEDFQMVQAICGAKKEATDKADYLFFDGTGADALDALSKSKVGTVEQPELGATLIFKCRDFDGDGTAVQLTGPGIATKVITSLPVEPGFIDQLQSKNDSFPMGVDLFFLSDSGKLLGLPRTTAIEVIP